jgi:hypothetical protein
VPESFFVYDVPTPDAWDYHARIGHIERLARRVFADARLVHISGFGIRPDGIVNLTNNRGGINYDFRSPSRSARGDRLKGERWTCLVRINVRADHIAVGPADSECDEPWLAARCRGRDLWKIAQARGAAPDQVANLYLYVYDVGWVWNLSTNEGKFEIPDSDCAR